MAQSDSIGKGLAYGAIASMLGDLVTMPIDVAKTRMQLSGEGGQKLYSNALDCILKTGKNEGIPALWKGLEPALWRQASYGSLRYGLYNPLKEVMAPGVPNNELSVGTKILAGGLSGVLAQAIANPCDLVKVRMMAQGMSPADAGAKAVVQYKWFWPSLVSILKSEGVRGMYKGVGANMSRAAALASGELASYDILKPELKTHLQLRDGLPLHAATAVCSGFIAAFIANPFDLVKSRVMRDSTGQYRGMIHCFTKTLRKEGVLALWKGFIPAWARVGPRVIIAFVTMEQLKIRFG
eukprot:gb/GEZN01013788.1/.p1 GENE.gb/GEZN01013788.1/~~gb/GEZN01013788.1/.p1  ORF type:complete len:295 (+),score=14.60 gb/GEZN01013788.1/:34-918(+)